MDIITHAATGAATGSLFGHPVAGALIAMAPDVVLSPRRRITPSTLYNTTHSFLFIAVVTIAAQLMFGVGLLVLLCLISHIVLDLPTHGATWAPPLLWPARKRFSMGSEWEWFNDSWWFGLCVALSWSTLCLSLFAIGFRL